MLSRHHQVALVDETAGRVLVTESGLPRHPGQWPWPPDLQAAVGAPGALPGAAPWRSPDGTVTHVLFGDGRSTLAEATWRPVDEVAVPGLAEACARWVVASPSNGDPAWFVRGWQDEVLAWIDGVLAERGWTRRGVPDLVKAWSLSAVLRVPVKRRGGESEVWFKATCDGFRAEPVLTAAVHELAPALTPALLAFDVERAWLVMEPIPGAADGAGAHRAAEVARQVAELQLASRGRRDELLAAGAPDRGLAGTLGMLGEVLHHSVDVLSPAQRAQAPSLESWLVAGLHELWDGPLPDTVVHGDLHLGNVAWTGTGPVVFDWTDLCLSHPFLDAAHLAESAAAEAGGDPTSRRAAADAVWSAYLSPWRAAYPDVDLDAVRARVPLAEAVFQAITYEQIYRAQPERSRWELATFVGRYIDTLAALRDAAAEAGPRTVD